MCNKGDPYVYLLEANHQVEVSGGSVLFKMACMWNQVHLPHPFKVNLTSCALQMIFVRPQKRAAGYVDVVLHLLFLIG